MYYLYQDEEEDWCITDLKNAGWVKLGESFSRNMFNSDLSPYFPNTWQEVLADINKHALLFKHEDYQAVIDKARMLFVYKYGRQT